MSIRTLSEGVEEAFGFLIDQGFCLQEPQVTLLAEQVALRGPKAQVVVTQERDGRLALSIAKAVDDQGAFDMDEVHPLEDLVALVQGEEAARALQAAYTHPEALEGLKAMAQALQACGSQMLAGDDIVFGALADQRVARKRARKFRHLTRHNFPPEAFGR